ncbi:MAG: DUF3299 domain-containing protein [Ideonella sp.]|nr:DUF3299 domain-containing protein [Ideonella sp.]MBL0150702.1 DUF3299 domain-containing protein [Ideonella sp.]
MNSLPRPDEVARRQWLMQAGATLASWSMLGPALAQAVKPPAKTGEPVEIKWDDLVPKGWDPMKGLPANAGNLAILGDGDPKAQDMYNKLRDAWDNAPTVAALDGAAIKLPGYLVPLDESKAGITEFLLVPYFGACIHTPPPPANQIVLVVPGKALQGYRSMDTVWVRGTLRAARNPSPMGTSAYRLEAAVVDRYTTPVK